MAGVRFYRPLALILLLWAGAARADDPQNPPQLYDRPVLAIDPGTHTGLTKSASADRKGRWAVTGSDDKTVRIWSLADGKLERTIRLPAGPGDIGKVYAVAMSPDGALIAAGGITNASSEDEQIYVFDRATGSLVQRIEGLPANVNRLVFSPDGDRLAAALLGSNGLRVYAKEGNWAQVARDNQYDGPSYGIDFAADGRLATTSFDGKLRLYAASLIGDVHPIITMDAPGGSRPTKIAFAPDGGASMTVGNNLSLVKVDVLHSAIGDRPYGIALTAGRGETIAVGNNVAPPDVDLLDSRTLRPLTSLGVGDGATTNGPLNEIAWSRDGRTLYAAGDGVFAWSNSGTGPRRLVASTVDTAFGLISLPRDDLLLAEARRLTRINSDGVLLWVREEPLADFRAQFDRLSVSTDGSQIEFGYKYAGKSPARFDIVKRVLLVASTNDPNLKLPEQTRLEIKDWRSGNRPTLDGKPLTMSPYEDSISLAIHPTGKSFVLGTDWKLRAYDAHGTPLWTRPAPGHVWAVNITGDGRLVVAAYGDGTIRWHRMTDGAELLAFMPLADRTNWVAWTPEGFYAATAGAQGVLRWHVNRGWEPADDVPVENIPGSYQPDLLPLVLQENETPRALGLTVLAEHNRQVMLRTHSHISPGAKLHLLTIGIDQYNEEYAKNLRLRFADKDAHDFASALVNTQSALYEVRPNVLLDKDANKKGILQALDNMRTGMVNGEGDDLAVIYFSGHGALVDGKLYLLPYEVDSRSNAGIKSDGLSVDDLRNELADLGQHGRVLVLLDACHSGATTTDGTPLSMDSTALRTALAAANVSVLTSSSGSEVSYEDPKLQHGAFTKALLDAFDDPEADIDRNGLITPSGLEHYVESRVPMFTDDKQHPGMELRYDATLFARSR